MFPPPYAIDQSGNVGFTSKVVEIDTHFGEKLFENLYSNKWLLAYMGLSPNIHHRRKLNKYVSPTLINFVYIITMIKSNGADDPYPS